MPRFDPALPLDRAKTIPSDYYTSPGIAQAESLHVFGKSWQCVGRAEQVAEPGQFLTAEIAGEPVLVIRDSEGQLRAFANVCRHRAAPLLTEPHGCVNKLRCRYHGWTYDLTGALRGTPEFDGVCDFDKASNGLVPLGGVTVAGPFVWVHLEKPMQPVTTEFAPFFAQSNFDGLQYHATRSYDLNCNWKVYIDNYLDGGYHVNTVHPALAGVLDYQQYRVELFERCNVQTSPLVSAEGSIGETRTGTAAYWWLYPNFMVNLYSGVLDTNLVLPLDTDHCRVIFDFYFQPGASSSFIQNSIDVAEVVQDEDILICEQVQRGLKSRSYSTGRFSVKREAGGYHFHRLVAAALEAESAGISNGSRPS